MMIFFSCMASTHFSKLKKIYFQLEIVIWPIHSTSSVFLFHIICTHKIYTNISYSKKSHTEYTTTKCLNKRVFLWDLDQPHSWGSDVSRIVRSAGYHGDILVVPYNIVNMVREHLETNYTQQWLTHINSMPKLRTYRTLKFTFGVEDYVSRPMDKYFRSALARVRMGVFPIRIETGRWRGLPLHDRICVNCDLDEVETEEHFLCVCPRHDALRNELKHRIAAATTDLEDMNNDEFIKCILCTATIRTIIGHYIINLQQNGI